MNQNKTKTNQESETEYQRPRFSVDESDFEPKIVAEEQESKSAAHSWNILQQSLALNQSCGDLLLNLEELDISLAIGFLDRAKLFINSSSNEKAIFQHHLYLLDNPSWKKLQEFP